MSLVKIGVVAWGTITVVLAIAALSLVIFAGYHMDADGKVTGLGWVGGVYMAVSENESLVAGILGFSGLAWAHFFQESGRA